MSDTVEFECESCGAVTTIEVVAGGDHGTDIKFCPVCGYEADDEDDDDDLDEDLDDDFWSLDDDDD